MSKTTCLSIIVNFTHFIKKKTCYKQLHFSRRILASGSHDRKLGVPTLILDVMNNSNEMNVLVLKVSLNLKSNDEKLNLNL